MKVYLYLFLGIVLNCGCELSAQAFGGKMAPLVYSNHSSNWRVSSPKVVVAFGLLQESLIKHYTKTASSYVQHQLSEINPAIQVQIIPKARGQDIVNALMDRDTVGLIFISHTFKTSNTQSTILVGADGLTLPSNILSAATPAFRFASFLGCHGSTLLGQYEINFQFRKPFGSKIFYETKDTYLSTKLTLVDNVDKIIKKVMKDLQTRLSPIDLLQGVEPDFTNDGKLTIRVKDVYPQLEPRYVQVNDQIIGLLGSGAENSNLDKDYRDLSFRVPFYAFQDFDLEEGGQVTSSEPSCHDVRILAAELTPGGLVDNYLIQSSVLEGPFGLRRRDYLPSWHLGDQELPIFDEVKPTPPVWLKSRKKRRKQVQEFLIKSLRFEEWLDRAPDPWIASPLKARFYRDCL
ncbi:MAG: hypothetical protein ABIQ95_06945 [Bdellovibrionia bacterium]